MRRRAAYDVGGAVAAVGQERQGVGQEAQTDLGDRDSNGTNGSRRSDGRRRAKNCVVRALLLLLVSSLQT